MYLLPGSTWTHVRLNGPVPFVKCSRSSLSEWSDGRVSSRAPVRRVKTSCATPRAGYWTGKLGKPRLQRGFWSDRLQDRGALASSSSRGQVVPRLAGPTPLSRGVVVVRPSGKAKPVGHFLGCLLARLRLRLAGAALFLVLLPRVVGPFARELGDFVELRPHGVF
jgi:hypothetical protein